MITHAQTLPARRRALFPLLLLGLSAAGCGPATATVSGVVKQANDAALPMGSIRFISDGPGHPARSGVIENGRYTAEGVVCGPNAVVIETPPVPPNASDPSKYVTIPRKYTDPDKTDLHVDIQGPTQTFDVTLKP